MKYGENRKFLDCETCGHPRMAHFGDACHCGCTRSGPEWLQVSATRALGKLVVQWEFAGSCDSWQVKVSESNKLLYSLSLGGEERGVSIRPPRGIMPNCIYVSAHQDREAVARGMSFLD